MIGRVLALRRAMDPIPGLSPPQPSWRLRGIGVCASTEWELDRWLDQGRAEDPATGRLHAPRAVIARRQRFGHGQAGRAWEAPAGGVWLSAALPWPAQGPTAAVGLAVAVGLMLQLERLGLAARLKWPNDLILSGRKLAGLLPGLRHRANQVLWARVGLGLNGRNPVPAGATNLRPSLGAWGAEPLRLTAMVLAALDWTMAAASQPELVRRQAECRLLLPVEPLWQQGEAWWPRGLASDGGLLLASGEKRRVLHREFPPHPALASRSNHLAGSAAGGDVRPADAC